MAQFTLEQLRRFGIVPDTDLGQHFLVDDNLLDVIGELAGLEAHDVAYEPGPGVGVLTAWLAEHASHVHAVELDRRLEPALTSVLADHDNVTLHWGDALQVQPARLEPQPTALVSNLPYHVAAPIVLEALQHAPTIVRWCVMVQREVADRMFAAPGGSNYGAVSVVVQALCTRTGGHRVSRSVFAPPPNVDSSLAGFRRRPAHEHRIDDVPAFARFVRTAFAHRRKTLANNLLGYGGSGEPGAGTTRAQVVASLANVGLKPAARPQELAADQFIHVYHELGGGGSR